MNSIVSKAEWDAKRIELLKKEKAFTRQRDELSILRRSLPWQKIDKEYPLKSKHGDIRFADMFDGRSQLIIYHFMFGPDWDEGCKSCSFWADHFNSIIIHLNQRDVSFGAISNGPIEKLLEFQKRMGWDFHWASSLNSDFNYDFNVSFDEGQEGEYNFKNVAAGPANERPGISVFYKDDQEKLYRTYSTYARGLEDFNTVYRYLDVVPKGRDEKDLCYAQEWVKLKDQYTINRQDDIDMF